MRMEEIGAYPPACVQQRQTTVYNIMQVDSFSKLTSQASLPKKFPPLGTLSPDRDARDRVLT